MFWTSSGPGAINLRLVHVWYVLLLQMEHLVGKWDWDQIWWLWGQIFKIVSMSFVTHARNSNAYSLCYTCISQGFDIWVSNAYLLFWCFYRYFCILLITWLLWRYKSITYKLINVFSICLHEWLYDEVNIILSCINSEGSPPPQIWKAWWKTSDFKI